MNDVEHDTIDGALVFYTHAGKLTDLAEVSLVAALMHHKTTQLYRGHEEVTIHSCEADLIGYLVPKTIKDEIRTLSNQMNTCRVEWWDYHWKYVFFCRMPPDDMITLMDELVWLADGTINFEQTARKLLDGDKLTNEQKFQIACTYCFIDDVNRLKDTLSLDEIHDAEAFLVYWWCKISYITSRRLALFVGDTDTDLFSELIAVKTCYDHWPALEYFWNQSRNDEERLRKAIVIIERSNAKLILHLLPKLTGSQLDSVMRKKGRDIVGSLSKIQDYTEFTILIWKRMVNVIDDNSLLRTLHMMECDVGNLIWKMWLCFSERQKMYFADQLKGQILEVNSIHNFLNVIKSTSYPLIVDLLSRWDIESRRQYWIVHWPRLVIGNMSCKCAIEQMMKMCLESDEEITVFKSTVMINFDRPIIKEAWESLLISARYEELENYLNFCSPEQEVNRYLKKQIIRAAPKNYLIRFLSNPPDVRLETEFENYIDDVFSADEAEEFKNDLIMFHFGNVRDLLPKFPVHDVILFVERYFSRGEDLKQMKLNFIQHSNKLYYENEIRLSEWLDLLAWCFDGNKSLVQHFKMMSCCRVPQNAMVESFHDDESSDVEMGDSNYRFRYLSRSIYGSFCKLYRDGV